MSELRPGTVIAGRFRIERRIGAGAMALVYEALHLELRQKVALKFLNDVYRADSDASARFVREARAQFSLRSEHVGRVFDVGRTESGQPFIVMELLEGQSLKEVLDARERLPVDEAVDILRQVCEGVGEAHALGIVHRDLKPGNIFVTPQPDGGRMVKVLDFGLAKARDHASEGSLTAADMLIGTPRYMAPEQFAHAGSAGAHTDVWSLGVVLYRMITGVLPFDGPHPLAIAHKIRKDDPAPPSKLVPEIPTALSDLVVRCMSRDPKARFPNATALGQALADLASATPDEREATIEQTMEMPRSSKPAASPKRPSPPPRPAPPRAGPAVAAAMPSRESATARISHPDVLPPSSGKAAKKPATAPPVEASELIEELSLSGDDLTEVAPSAPVLPDDDGSVKTRVTTGAPGIATIPAPAPNPDEAWTPPRGGPPRDAGPMLPLPPLDEADQLTRKRPAVFTPPEAQHVALPFETTSPAPFRHVMESSPNFGPPSSPALNVPMPVHGSQVGDPLGSQVSLVRQKIAAAGPAGYFAIALAVSATLMLLVVILVSPSKDARVRSVPPARSSTGPLPAPVVPGARVFTTLDEFDAGPPTPAPTSSSRR